MPRTLDDAATIAGVAIGASTRVVADVAGSNQTVRLETASLSGLLVRSRVVDLVDDTISASTTTSIKVDGCHDTVTCVVDSVVGVLASAGKVRADHDVVSLRESATVAVAGNHDVVHVVVDATAGIFTRSATLCLQDDRFAVAASASVTIAGSHDVVDVSVSAIAGVFGSGEVHGVGIESRATNTAVVKIVGNDNKVLVDSAAHVEVYGRDETITAPGGTVDLHAGASARVVGGGCRVNLVGSGATVTLAAFSGADLHVAAGLTVSEITDLPDGSCRIVATAAKAPFLPSPASTKLVALPDSHTFSWSVEASGALAGLRTGQAGEDPVAALAVSAGAASMRLDSWDARAVMSGHHWTHAGE